jgi:hypothetical protein
MAKRSMLRYPHKVDLYEKTTTTQASGQKLASWTLSQERTPCQYAPDRTYIRVNPTAEETEKVIFFLPASATIDYGYRLQNVVDRKNNVIFPGPFEIVTILSFPGYGGKLHHYLVKAELVIE